ncbi:peptidoglycan DD-metalloendopeptidase family protein [Rhodovibrionaceae bacterium A322]
MRGNDRVVALRLSSRLQKSTALTLLLVTAWGGFSSVSFFLQRDDLALRQTEIQQAQKDFYELMAEVDGYQSEFSRIAKDLDATQVLLLGLAAGQDQPNEASPLSHRLEENAEARARAVVARDDMRHRLERFGGTLEQIAKRNSTLHDQVVALRTNLERSENENLEVGQARALLGERLSSAQNRITKSNAEKVALEDEVNRLKEALSRSEQQVAELSSSKSDLEQERLALQTARSEDSEREHQLRTQLAQQQAALTSTLSQRDQLDQEGKSLTAEISNLNEQIAQADRVETSLLSALDNVRERERFQNLSNAQLEIERRDLRQEIARLERNRDALLEHQSSLQDQLALNQQTLKDSRTEVVALRDQRDLLQLRLSGVHERLKSQRDAQLSVLANLRVRTQESTATLVSSVAKTGLKAEQYLAEQLENEGAQGGPFVPLLSLEDTQEESNWRSSVELLEEDVTRWEQMMKLVRTLPLTNPVLGENWISSGYGYRRDPINGRKALHAGVDIAAKANAKVAVPSAGKVIFVGWKTGYGRVIYVEHGYGVVTRYAHLNKILVKNGQQVAADDVIGLVGSSGRSTGPHVHYEIRFKNKARNPKKFLRAGRNVQEVKKEGRI